MSPLWTAESLLPFVDRFVGRVDRQTIADVLNAYDAERERLEAEAKPLAYYPAQLLARIRLEGGRWTPARAADALRGVGSHVEPMRAAEFMKQLAARGHLVKTSPRSFTYTLPEGEEPQ